MDVSKVQLQNKDESYKVSFIFKLKVKPLPIHQSPVFYSEDHSVSLAATELLGDDRKSYQGLKEDGYELGSKCNAFVSRPIPIHKIHNSRPLVVVHSLNIASAALKKNHIEIKTHIKLREQTVSHI